VLVFGPHPDDIEIGIGGTVARHVTAGYRVGLVDLTAGEMGTNGTVEERRREADAAAKVLGVAWRENLGWPDGGIDGSPALVRSAVECLRRHRPRAVAIPFAKDRHPDHRGAHRTLYEATFKSGLRRYDAAGEPWRPESICYYFINDTVEPSFVIDVSDVYDRKRESLACYQSQFAPKGPGAVSTRLSAPSFRQLIETRDAQFGARVGVAYAEGIVVDGLVRRETVFA